MKIQEFKKHLLDFVEDQYPKQKPDTRHIKRGQATVVLTLFWVWLIKKKILK